MAMAKKKAKSGFAGNVNLHHEEGTMVSGGKKAAGTMFPFGQGGSRIDSKAKKKK